MSTNQTEKNEALNKEQLVEKVKKLAENEKFKLDAYFLCGFPTGAPNEDLMNACEKYLDTLEDASANKDAAAKLVKELEADKESAPDVAARDNITSNTGLVDTILANKNILLG